MAGRAPSLDRQLSLVDKHSGQSRQSGRKRIGNETKWHPGRYNCSREDAHVVQYGVQQARKFNGRQTMWQNTGKQRVSKERQIHTHRVEGDYQAVEGDNGESLLQHAELQETLKKKLLNFRYERQGVQSVPQRRRKTAAPFKKEVFLQANCNFVLRRDDFSHKLASDPDIPVDWEGVEQVCLRTNHTLDCPICLYPPTAAKITKCGHVYCWACIIHFLFVSEKRLPRCPICADVVKMEDLKSVTVLPFHKFVIGEKIRMFLMKRKKGSLITMPLNSWYETGQAPINWTDWESFGASKLQVASARTILDNVVNNERRELLEQMKRTGKEQTKDEYYIESALAQLQEREQELLQRCSLEESSRYNADHTRPILEKQQDCELDASIPGIDGKDMEMEKEGLGLEIPSSAPKSANISSPADSCNKSLAVPMIDQFYYFYQAYDGQYLYIHPLNVRCLIKEYGSLENCPSEITGKIQEAVTYSMNPELRRRYRYLSHLPIACEFSICELLLGQDVLSEDTIKEFAQEFRRRKRQRGDKKKYEKRMENKMEANQTMDCFGRAIIRPVGPLNLDLKSHEDFPLQVHGDSSSNRDTLAAEEDQKTPPASSLSFSDALRVNKTPVSDASAHLTRSNAGAARDFMKEDSGAEEDDLEYAAIVPSFSQSFSEALTTSFQNLEVETDTSEQTRKGKKGRRKKKQVLFSTNQTRLRP